MVNFKEYMLTEDSIDYAKSPQQIAQDWKLKSANNVTKAINSLRSVVTRKTLQDPKQIQNAQEALKLLSGKSKNDGKSTLPQGQKPFLKKNDLRTALNKPLNLPENPNEYGKDRAFDIHKDKFLDADIQTMDTKAFQDFKLHNSDKAFEKEVKNFKGKDLRNKGTQFRVPAYFIENSKVPKRYWKTYERMMNTQAASSDTPPISLFMKDAGAGQITSQAGELTSLLFISMNDKDYKEFRKHIKDHMELRDHDNPDTKQILTKDWVTAAENNRKAIIRSLKKEHGEISSSNVIAAAWDNKNDVEALGLREFDKNKSDSSDIFLKVGAPVTGQSKLIEISLKKDTKFSFFNGSTTEIENWDPKLPDDVNVNKFLHDRANTYRKTLEENKDKFPEIMKNMKLRKYLKENNLTLEDCLKTKGKTKKSTKAMYLALDALAKKDKETKKLLSDLDTTKREMTSKLITEFTKNPHLSQGMMGKVRSSFPIKAVADGDEIMAVGALSVDKEVINHIFGTSDWSKIEEKLVATSVDGKSYLGYQTSCEGKVIPVANIDIREDGAGYASRFKFEMRIALDFAKLIKDANKEVYNHINESFSFHDLGMVF